ncbi:hypothetical protein [Mesorhizobium sp. BH1-1-4]|uniref:hypothetical protein n=1 Tax=Mesorhizobium sp. BH1-1-4 TaxID=2876662 RepID=UPI001CD045FA|nr:hypothetical protein [Mesorhizobium sp. BH1-1-4]MBZ9994036.1 hypothetical protein [Mesorhizobium sp. BH1-1-4]
MSLSQLHLAARRLLGIAMLCSVGIPTGVTASTPDKLGKACLPLNESITYLSVELPEKLQSVSKNDFLSPQRNSPETDPFFRAQLGPDKEFKAVAVKYASVDNFIEQLPIALFADERPFLKSLKTIPIEKSLEDALGFGGPGTMFAEPTNVERENSYIKIEVQESDDKYALSDASGTIVFTTGLVRQVVSDAIKHNFGGMPEYERHLKEILSFTDESGLLASNVPTNVAAYALYTPDDNEPRRFPIGQVYVNGENATAYNPYKHVLPFAREVLNKLFFIGAHEAGHIRLGHYEDQRRGCEVAKEKELAADDYAAKALANYNFWLKPVDASSVPEIEFAPFFKSFATLGFTGVDTDGCAYPPPEERLDKVRDSYQTALNQLFDLTMYAPQIDTPNPVAMTCDPKERVWKLRPD